MAYEDGGSRDRDRQQAAQYPVRIVPFSGVLRRNVGAPKSGGYSQQRLQPMRPSVSTYGRGVSTKRRTY